MDPFVIDIPTPFRWLLVNYISLTRPKSVVPKYKTIWTKFGSLLFVNTLNFKNKLEDLLGDDFIVEIGMRYGSPSIKQALESFADRNIRQIVVYQMYPQAAYSSTFSNEALINTVAKNLGLSVRIIPPFFQNDSFVKCLKQQVQTHLKGTKWEHLVMSFHGIPLRQTFKQSQNLKCGTTNCCESFEIQNCYKAQCHQTARVLAQELGLEPHQYTVSFQSRLNDKWIQPYTDHVLIDLPKKGIKDVAIISPSFVCDCLETLEELHVRERERFSSAGGHIFTYIPCLNDNEPWVQAVKELIAPK